MNHSRRNPLLSIIQLDEKQKELIKQKLMIKMMADLQAIHSKFLRKIDQLDTLINKKVGPKGDPGDKGLPGEPGAAGPGYTPDMIDLIIDAVHARIKVPEGKPGKDGIFSNEHIDKVARLVRAQITIDSKDNKEVEVDPLAFLDLLMKKTGGKGIPMKLIDGLEQTLSARHNQLDHGYLHGAGITALMAGSGIQLVKDNNGNYTIIATGGLGTIYTETPTGAIDGSNKAYTTAHTINTVLSFYINGEFIHPSQYSVSGDTITFVTALDSSLSGLPFTIIYA